MKKRSERKDSSVPQSGGPDIAALISKMQQQLVSLEKKIDVLIAQPPQRHSHSFSRPSRYGNERQDNRPAERRFYRVICADCNKECEVPFRPSADRPVYCRDCFSKRKGGDALFKGKQDKKKPFSKHRKKRG